MTVEKQLPQNDKKHSPARIETQFQLQQSNVQKDIKFDKEHSRSSGLDGSEALDKEGFAAYILARWDSFIKTPCAVKLMEALSDLPEHGILEKVRFAIREQRKDEKSGYALRPENEKAENKDTEPEKHTRFLSRECHVSLLPKDQQYLTIEQQLEYLRALNDRIDGMLCSGTIEYQYELMVRLAGTALRLAIVSQSYVWWEYIYADLDKRLNNIMQDSMLLGNIFDMLVGNAVNPCDYVTLKGALARELDSNNGDIKISSIACDRLLLIGLESIIGAQLYADTGIVSKRVSEKLNPSDKYFPQCFYLYEGVLCYSAVAPSQEEKVESLGAAAGSASSQSVSYDIFEPSSESRAWALLAMVKNDHAVFPNHKVFCKESAAIKLLTRYQQFVSENVKFKANMPKDFAKIDDTYRKLRSDVHRDIDKIADDYYGSSEIKAVILAELKSKSGLSGFHIQANPDLLDSSVSFGEESLTRRLIARYQDFVSAHDAFKERLPSLWGASFFVALNSHQDLCAEAIAAIKGMVTDAGIDEIKAVILRELELQQKAIASYQDDVSAMLQFVSEIKPAELGAITQMVPVEHAGSKEHLERTIAGIKSDLSGFAGFKENVLTAYARRRKSGEVCKTEILTEWLQKRISFIFPLADIFAVTDNGIFDAEQFFRILGFNLFRSSFGRTYTLLQFEDFYRQANVLVPNFCTALLGEDDHSKIAPCVTPEAVVNLRSFVEDNKNFLAPNLQQLIRSISISNADIAQQRMLRILDNASPEDKRLQAMALAEVAPFGLYPQVKFISGKQGALVQINGSFGGRSKYINFDAWRCYLSNYCNTAPIRAMLARTLSPAERDEHMLGILKSDMVTLGFDDGEANFAISCVEELFGRSQPVLAAEALALAKVHQAVVSKYAYFRMVSDAHNLYMVRVFWNYAARMPGYDMLFFEFIDRLICEMGERQNFFPQDLMVLRYFLLESVFIDKDPAVTAANWRQIITSIEIAVAAHFKGKNIPKSEVREAEDDKDADEDVVYKETIHFWLYQHFHGLRFCSSKAMSLYFQTAEEIYTKKDNIDELLVPMTLLHTHYVGNAFLGGVAAEDGSQPSFSAGLRKVGNAIFGGYDTDFLARMREVCDMYRSSDLGIKDLELQLQRALLRSNAHHYARVITTLMTKPQQLVVAYCIDTAIKMRVVIEAPLLYKFISLAKEDVLQEGKLKYAEIDALLSKVPAIATNGGVAARGFGEMSKSISRQYDDPELRKHIAAIVSSIRVPDGKDLQLKDQFASAFAGLKKLDKGIRNHVFTELAGLVKNGVTESSLLYLLVMLADNHAVGLFMNFAEAVTALSDKNIELPDTLPDICARFLASRSKAVIGHEAAISLAKSFLLGHDKGSKARSDVASFHELPSDLFASLEVGQVANFVALDKAVAQLQKVSGPGKVHYLAALDAQKQLTAVMNEMQKFVQKRERLEKDLRGANEDLANLKKGTVNDGRLKNYHSYAERCAQEFKNFTADNPQFTARVPSIYKKFYDQLVLLRGSREPVQAEIASAEAAGGALGVLEKGSLKHSFQEEKQEIIKEIKSRYSGSLEQNFADVFAAIDKLYKEDGLEQDGASLAGLVPPSAPSAQLAAGALPEFDIIKFHADMSGVLAKRLGAAEYLWPMVEVALANPAQLAEMQEAITSMNAVLDYHLPGEASTIFKKIIKHYHKSPDELISLHQSLKNSRLDGKHAALVLKLIYTYIRSGVSLDGIDDVIGCFAKDESKRNLLEQRLLYPPYLPLADIRDKDLSELASAGGYERVARDYTKFDKFAAKFKGTVICDELFAGEFSDNDGSKVGFKECLEQLDRQKRGLGLEQLQVDLATARSKFMGKGPSPSDQEILDAVVTVAEILARVSFDGSGEHKKAKELRLSQIMSAFAWLKLSLRTDKATNTTWNEVATGEGKSRINAVVAGALTALSGGKTAEMAFHSGDLALDGLEEFTPLFKHLYRREDVTVDIGVVVDSGVNPTAYKVSDEKRQAINFIAMPNFILAANTADVFLVRYLTKANHEEIRRHAEGGSVFLVDAKFYGAAQELLSSGINGDKVRVTFSIDKEIAACRSLNEDVNIVVIGGESNQGNINIAVDSAAATAECHFTDNRGVFRLADEADSGAPSLLPYNTSVPDEINGYWDSPNTKSGIYGYVWEWLKNELPSRPEFEENKVDASHVLAFKNFVAQQEVNNPNAAALAMAHINLERLEPFRLEAWFKAAREAANMQEGVDFIFVECRDENGIKYEVIVPLHAGGDAMRNSSFSGGVQQMLNAQELSKRLSSGEQHLPLLQQPEASIVASKKAPLFLPKCALGPRESNVIFRLNTTGTPPHQIIVGTDDQCLQTPRDKDLCRYRIPSMVVKEEEHLEQIISDILRCKLLGRPAFILCENERESSAIFEAINQRFTDMAVAQYSSTLSQDKKDAIIKAAGDKNAVVIGTVIDLGRGVDIKPSPEAAQNGGLHLILTHYPKDEATYLQAVARAGRNGVEGSVRVITKKDGVTEEMGAASRRHRSKLAGVYQIQDAYSAPLQLFSARVKYVLSKQILTESDQSKRNELYAMLHAQQEAYRNGVHSKIAALVLSDEADFSGVRQELEGYYKEIIASYNLALKKKFQHREDVIEAMELSADDKYFDDIMTESIAYLSRLNDADDAFVPDNEIFVPRGYEFLSEEIKKDIASKPKLKPRSQPKAVSLLKTASHVAFLGAVALAVSFLGISLPILLPAAFACIVAGISLRDKSDVIAVKKLYEKDIQLEGDYTSPLHLRRLGQILSYALLASIIIASYMIGAAYFSGIAVAVATAGPAILYSYILSVGLMFNLYSWFASAKGKEALALPHNIGKDTLAKLKSILWSFGGRASLLLLVLTLTSFGLSASGFDLLVAMLSISAVSLSGSMAIAVAVLAPLALVSLFAVGDIINKALKGRLKFVSLPEALKSTRKFFATKMVAATGSLQLAVMLYSSAFILMFAFPPVMVVGVNLLPLMNSGVALVYGACCVEQARYIVAPHTQKFHVNNPLLKFAQSLCAVAASFVAYGFLSGAMVNIAAAAAAIYVGIFIERFVSNMFLILVLDLKIAFPYVLLPKVTKDSGWYKAKRILQKMANLVLSLALLPIYFVVGAAMLPINFIKSFLVNNNSKAHKAQLARVLGFAMATLFLFMVTSIPPLLSVCMALYLNSVVCYGASELLNGSKTAGAELRVMGMVIDLLYGPATDHVCSRAKGKGAAKPPVPGSGSTLKMEGGEKAAVTAHTLK